jgi:hypothetical protein
MAAKKKFGRTTVSAGISIDPHTYARAKARAKELRMGWSEYVRRCLDLDLGAGGEMVIRPSPSPDDPKHR